MNGINDQRVTYFAKTDARNRQTPFGIKSSDRTRHVYVIGKTGMGKSTLLENMAAQDIRNGEGFAFVDPHGKSADLLLDYIPRERMKDVIYFAPFDMDFPIALNVMEDVGYDKRHLVVNGLMAAFKKIWVDAWSARMEYILQNTMLALLEYPDATMLDVNRMYTDRNFREKVVGKPATRTEPAREGFVKDPLVKSFWQDEYANFTDRYTQEATPAIQNKVGQFTGNPLIRNIVGQKKSTFDFREVMDQRKIVIVNLSKGQVGEGNANLLGSMIITKIYLAALSRADVPEATLRTLPNFYLYVDEFQSFANESFADILSEARKYKLNLTIAHQYIEQMSEEVRAAVFGNVGTMIVFRVGAFDAEVLEKEFAPQFTAIDLVNLGFAQVYLKLMIDGVSSQPFSATTLPPIAPPEESLRTDVLQMSRDQFANPRGPIEEGFREEYEAQQRERVAAAEQQSRRARDENSRGGGAPMRRGGERDDRPPYGRPSERPVDHPPLRREQENAPDRHDRGPSRPPPERPLREFASEDRRVVPERDKRSPVPPPAPFPSPPAGERPFGDAFVQALRERSEVPTPPRPTPPRAFPPRPPAPRSPEPFAREREDDRLRPRDDRTAKPETLTGLREALQALAKKDESARASSADIVNPRRNEGGATPPPESPSDYPPASPGPQQQKDPDTRPSVPPPKPPRGEVPEDTLRKLLDSDSP